MMRIGDVARDAGFTLREISKLFAGRPYSARLRDLANDKIAELEGTVERVRTMQSLLRSALRCNCLTPEACGRVIRRADPRRPFFARAAQKHVKISSSARKGSSI